MATMYVCDVIIVHVTSGDTQSYRYKQMQKMQSNLRTSQPRVKAGKNQAMHWDKLS